MATKISFWGNSAFTSVMPTGTSSVNTSVQGKTRANMRPGYVFEPDITWAANTYIQTYGMGSAGIQHWRKGEVVSAGTGWKDCPVIVVATMLIDIMSQVNGMGLTPGEYYNLGAGRTIAQLTANYVRWIKQLMRRHFVIVNNAYPFSTTTGGAFGQTEEPDETKWTNPANDPHANSNLEIFTAAMKSEMADLGVTFIDTASYMRDSAWSDNGYANYDAMTTAIFGDDDLHLKSAGHQIIYDYWKPRFDDALSNFERHGK